MSMRWTSDSQLCCSGNRPLAVKVHPHERDRVIATWHSWSTVLASRRHVAPVTRTKRTRCFHRISIIRRTMDNSLLSAVHCCATTASIVSGWCMGNARLCLSNPVVRRSTRVRLRSRFAFSVNDVHLRYGIIWLWQNYEIYIAANSSNKYN